MRNLILILVVATLAGCGIQGDPLPQNLEAPCPFCE